MSRKRHQPEEILMKPRQVGLLTAVAACNFNYGARLSARATGTVHISSFSVNPSGYRPSRIRKHSGDALDGLALAAWCANADTGQIQLEDVANAAAADAVDAGERPDAGPGPAGNQLPGAFLVNVNDADQPLDRIGVDVDARGNGGAGEDDEG